MAPLISMPYSSHKIEHFTHHRYTNHPDKDPDLMVGHMRHGFIAVIVTVFKFLWFQNRFLFKDHWAKMSQSERNIYRAEVSLSIGWRLAFLAFFPSIATFLMLFIGYLAGGLFATFWFAYRPHLPYDEQARYRNTNSLIMPFWMKPLEWFWFGQNLHSIHHAFPRVPFYRYHAIFREMEPILRAYGAPIIGIFDRKPID
jgi:beta-carotene hydroxylase